ncbi:PREDICTED: beta-microseminoprotein-like [Elephantulus edwardii]|uniref:beta-microseminoprotein-like n=1 Tax=Elephantulus edwardii TaxID=28737 RepID=UPI0003F0C55D|nr:PREDICTED: beta-microseminoprotein-like [Elephantulus edwardii]
MRRPAGSFSRSAKEVKNRLLGYLVVLATFVTSCNAYCYTIPFETVSGKSAVECKDDNGVIHPIYTVWKTDSCERCSCWEDGISCCSIVSSPMGYYPDNCKLIFHWENCSYTVLENDNRRENCDDDRWIK